MLEAENIFFSYQKGEPPVLKGNRFLQKATVRCRWSGSTRKGR